MHRQMIRLSLPSGLVRLAIVVATLGVSFLVATAVVYASTAPDAPTGVSGTVENARSTVTFSAPGSDGGSVITGYTVTSSPAGGTDSNAGTTGLSHIVTGLTNGTAYTFTVKATNSVGDSAASTASAAVTPAPITVCASGCDYATIQAGVDAVASGGTVNVAAGTYHESQIVIDGAHNSELHGLTLQGAGAASTIIDGDNAAAVLVGSGIHPGTFYIKNPSALVKIDGFTFSNPVTTPSEITDIAVAFGSGAPVTGSITISNNHFIGVSTGSNNLDDNAIWIYSAPAGVVSTITDNEFEHQWQSILLELPQGGAVVTGNNFHNLFASSSVPPQALSLWQYGGVNVTAPVTINTNSFSAFDGWSIVLRGGGSGNAQFLNNVTIRGNNISADGAGIVLRNPATTSSDAASDGIVGATISGNTMTSMTPGAGTGIWLRGPNNNPSMTENSVTGYANGILSEEYNPGPGVGVSTGVAATSNWWGSATGPAHTSNAEGTGDAVSGTGVTFSPWCSVQACTGALYAIPDRLAFATQPGGALASSALSPQPVVQAQDAAGHLGINFAGSVTLAIGTNPGSGTIGGTTTKAAVAGVATFNNNTISAAGTGYTLAFSSAGLTGATSSAFNITAPAPAPAPTPEAGVTPPPAASPPPPPGDVPNVSLGTVSTVATSATVETSVTATASTGAQAAVTVSAGALPAGSTLQVASVANAAALVEAAPPPAGASIVAGFQINATTASGAALTGDFAAPVVVEFSLPAASIPAGTASGDLVLAFWNGSSWTEVPATVVVNADGSVTVTASLSHFTVFSVQARAAVAAGAFSPAPVAGVTITSWSGGDLTALLTALSGSKSGGVFVGGQAIGYVVNAPTFVNADFVARYPTGVPAGTFMVVVR